VVSAAQALPARTPWTGAVIAAAFLLTPPVAYGGVLGFAILPAVAALLVWPAWRRRRAPHPVLLILAALWLWAAASYAWSPATPRSLGDLESLTALKLLLLLVCGGLFVGAAGGLSGPAARRGLLALAYIAALYALVLTVESFFGEPPLYRWFGGLSGDVADPGKARIHLGQGAVVLSLLVWPLALALRRARGGEGVTAMLLIGAALAPALLNQASGVLALLVGGLVFGLGARLGVTGIRTVGGLTALLVLAAPWLVRALDGAGALQAMKRLAPASTDARLDIWALVAERVAQNPLRGWGLDASRLLPPPVPLHPHNGPLQIWFELGAHGAVLAALVWWVLFDLCARAARQDRAGGAAAAGATAAYFTIGALSFGVWQEWWLGLGAVTAAVCAAMLVMRRWERLALPQGAASGNGRLRPMDLQPL